MSKLAHSNDETMAEIERKSRERDKRGEPDEPIEIISKRSQHIGGVTVNFTIGRIRPSKDGE